MTLRYLTQQLAQQIDTELMNPELGGFAIEQLMELAGLSVAESIAKEYAAERYPRVLVCCGPGNNGGDGLVCARHLTHFGYQPRIYYPKQGRNQLFQLLIKQCNNLSIPICKEAVEQAANEADLIVDSVFGFSFGGSVREPFPQVIQLFRETKLPVVSVDIPSGWDVDKASCRHLGNDTFQPDMLISLTAPKLGARNFKVVFTTWEGALFPRNSEMASRYALNLPNYPGTDQCVRLTDKQ
ncbi:YjeF N-terminal domain-containing protein [Syncephalis fuscata]|nr:YjeF N-terminal domain-containing protein [Syncephalis fuscata]